MNTSISDHMTIKIQPVSTLNLIDNNIICSFCSKEFSCKLSLIRHQKTTKSCLKLQGKEEIDTVIHCENCNKKLAFEYYKKHKINCDLLIEKYKKNKEDLKKIKLYDDIKDKYKLLEKETQELKKINSQNQKIIEKMKLDLMEYKTTICNLKETITILKEQNDKLQSISTSVTMKLAEKASTINNHKTVVINSPLTNEVLRKCAETFTIDNAYNINGITKHLTSSLEEHVKCTDAARNIFKYVNEKDEEIVDQDLENLIPQYLSAIKDRNNFLYKEVFEYFKKNNIPFDSQTDYTVFYQALNNIIEKSGQQSKYTEKCKQYMVRECKKQFLERNRKKEKGIIKKLSEDDIIINVIESGGTLYDYICKAFPEYIEDEEESEEQFIHRRNMEDIFRKKKREWKESGNQDYFPEGKEEKEEK